MLRDTPLEKCRYRPGQNSNEEAMLSYDLKYDFALALRAGAVALGLLTLAPGEATAEAGAGLRQISPRAEAPAQVSGSPSHAPAAGPDRIGEPGGDGPGDLLGGREALAMQGSGVSAAFDALSRLKQARVMQRCRDILARPAQAEASQLTICETLMMMPKP
jgi:hypothetical protein